MQGSDGQRAVCTARVAEQAGLGQQITDAGR